jgi:hypothetical protein
MFRAACFLVVMILLIPSSTLLARSTYSRVTESAGQQPKRKKQKKYKAKRQPRPKKLILKGHHERHKGRPA